MESLLERLMRVSLNGSSPPEKLCHLFEVSMGEIPARQKICDILAGRCAIPQILDQKLKVMEAREDLLEALNQAWIKHSVTTLWSMNESSACNPSRAHIVAKELQHGDMDAFRDARKILDLKSRLDILESGDHAFT